MGVIDSPMAFIHQRTYSLVLLTLVLLYAGATVFAQECDEALASALNVAFISVLVSGGCDLRFGFDVTCPSTCKEAILSTGQLGGQCLAVPAFGDDVIFSGLRDLAASIGLGGALPSSQRMNMTGLNEWTSNYCGASIFTGEEVDPVCAEPLILTEASGTIPGYGTIPGTEGEKGYTGALRCIAQVSLPEGAVGSNERIKVVVDSVDLDFGEVVVIQSGQDIIPIMVLTGRSAPSRAAYGLPGVGEMTVSFLSDTEGSDGDGFIIEYSVSDDDMDALSACPDPDALNYVEDTQLGKNTKCVYGFENGMISLTGQLGNVEVVGTKPAVHLPEREMTMAVWVRVTEFNENNDNIAFISHHRDDFTVEDGFQLGQIEDAFSCSIFTENWEGVIGSFDGYVYTDDEAGKVKLGEWQHVACTYDGQVVTLYVNGVEVASSPPGKFSGNVRYPEEQFASLYGEVFAIGAKHDGNEYQPMIGEVDEVVLWDQYLGPEDIQKLAAAAEVPTELPPPLHWYRFNEITGEAVVDYGSDPLDARIFDPLGTQVTRKVSTVP